MSLCALVSFRALAVAHDVIETIPSGTEKEAKMSPLHSLYSFSPRTWQRPGEEVV